MLHLACKRKLDRPFVKSSHFFTTLHDRSGKTDVWSHWTTLHGDAIIQINCQKCAVWISQTILSKPMLYLWRR
jgi:hypothetical protein